MATKKHRVNITVDDKTFNTLSKLSDQKNQSVSRVGAELIELAIELDEDRYFSGIADARLSKKERLVDHDSAWK